MTRIQTRPIMTDWIPQEESDPIKEPLLKTKKPALEYGPIKGELFVDGVSADDIRQGALGDCYFVSSLSAIAGIDPQWICDSIQSNPDNTFTVRFFRYGKPIEITVDNEFLHSPSGRLVYGSSTDKGELWIAVMEKAYAQWKGGYERIGQGGNPAKALYELTGVRGHLLLDGSMAAEELFQRLKEGLENHQALVAGTYSGPEQIYNEDNLVTSHAYTVIGVKEEDEQQYVVLRNPWGKVEWNGEGADKRNDGTFKMPIEAFQRMFNLVAYTQLPTRQKRAS